MENGRFHNIVTKIKSYQQELVVTNIIQSTSHPTFYKVLAKALEGGFLEVNEVFGLPTVEAEIADSLDIDDKIRITLFAEQIDFHYPENGVVNFAVQGPYITYKLELWNQQLSMWDYLFHVDMGARSANE